MTESFKINKKSYHTKNIYCSIDINNIEKYLKRIEIVQNTKKGKIEVILVPSTLVFSKTHIEWALFIAKSRFLDKINISKKIFTELLMILSCTNQIKNVSEKWYLKEGKNKCYLLIISKEKIDVKDIKKDLKIKEEKEPVKKNIKEIVSFYKVRNLKKIEEEIIERMATNI